jgi:hypothetical protein
VKSNTLFLSLVTVIFLWGNFSYAAYDDAGTDYSNQKLDSWVQDRAGDGLKMVNAFVCIVRASNGGTRPNATWKALIDEITCELKQSDDEGGGSGAVSYAEATMTSTRAADSSPQEMKAYFASTSGSNYVSSMSLNEMPSSKMGFIMDFRWYQSQGDNTQGTHSNTMNGWSEITTSDNDSDGNIDTVIRHTEYGPAEGGDPEFFMGATAVQYGPNHKVTKFISSNIDYEMGDGSGTKVFYQGVTDETKYRRRTLAGDGSTALQTECYDKTKQWANTWDYNLYDNVTGEEVAISGSFGFTYSNDTKRGYMGHWGVHMDGGNADYPSGSTTVAIKQKDTGTSMTVQAAPGRLTKITSTAITIANGDKFKVWGGSGDIDVYYNSSCSRNFTTNRDLTCNSTPGDANGFQFPGTYWAGAVSLGAGDWLYSEMNRAEILLGTLPNATMFERTEISPTSSSPDVSADLTLTCVGWCPKGKPLKSEIENYQTRNFCLSPFGTNKDGEGSPTNVTGCQYTFKNRDDGNNPMTMFRRGNSTDKVVPYKDASNVMTLADASQGRHYGIGGGRYIFDSDIGGNCAAIEDPTAANNIWNCTNGVYEWRSGIERWDQYYYAKYDNGSYVNIENPVKIKYTFASAHDQNNDNFTLAAPFSYIEKVPSKSASGVRDGNGYDNVTTSTYPALFANKTFVLEYEGAGNLQGFPERRTDNNWLKLINPKSGTQMTDADNSSKGYVVKAVGTGMMLAKHGTSTACDSMNFDFASGAIPLNTEKPLPQYVWSSKPTVNSVSVKHGEEQ